MNIQQLINFCVNSTEEDFFKYLMLSVAFDNQEQELKNLLEKHDNRTNIPKVQ